MPDVACVILDRAVCGEDACVCDVCKGHLLPLHSIPVALGGVSLSLLVGIEVGQSHVRILSLERVGDLRELLAVDAACQRVNCISDNGIGVVNVDRSVVRLGGVHLVNVHTEDDDVGVAHLLVDLNVCAVHGAEGNGAVYHQLHVAGARSLGACEGDLLGDLGGGHELLGEGYAVVLEEDDVKLFGELLVASQLLRDVPDELDDLLCHIVSGSGLGGKDIGLGHEVCVGVLLEVVVLRDDVQRVELLSLVLVQALYLNVEDRVGVEHNAVLVLDILGKVLLVLELDRGEAFEHFLVVRELVEL